MLVNIGETKHLSQLLSFLVQGEKLARNFSRQQSDIFSDDISCRFFAQQSRHEFMHVNIFNAGIRYTNARGPNVSFPETVMNNYAGLLNEAINSGNHAETIMGLQVILEGFGDVILNRLNDGLEKRGNQIGRIRKTILSQEDVHHTFGLKRLEEMTRDDPELKSTLIKRAEDYFELINCFLAASSGLFSHFHIDPRIYHEGLNENLPEWLVFKPS